MYMPKWLSSLAPSSLSSFVVPLPCWSKIYEWSLTAHSCTSPSLHHNKASNIPDGILFLYRNCFSPLLLPFNQNCLLPPYFSCSAYSSVAVWVSTGSTHWEFLQILGTSHTWNKWNCGHSSTWKWWCLPFSKGRHKIKGIKSWCIHNQA